MVLNHIQLQCADLSASTAFYLSALKPLGYTTFMKSDEKGAELEGCFVGLGIGYKPDLWLASSAKTGKPAHSNVHVAFDAPSRAMVDEVYKAALAAGAKSNGPPGIRFNYTPFYYAAYFLDPDGNNVEVCNIVPQWTLALPYAAFVGAVVGLFTAWKLGKEGYTLF